MKKTGLILGGGGIVGIAWELGVVAGLREHAGFDPKAMHVIVGSSAGSAAGALLALGSAISRNCSHSNGGYLRARRCGLRRATMARRVREARR